MNDITEVWAPGSAILAIIGGVAYGLAVSWVARNPTYSSSIAGPIRIGTLTTLFAASGGLVFFALQALGTYLAGDPDWTRVMSRYGQWVLFSVAIGVTTYVLVRHDRASRRKRAHAVVTGEPR